LLQQASKIHQSLSEQRDVAIPSVHSLNEDAEKTHRGLSDYLVGADGIG
jgi:hypothetical protein